MVVEVRALVVPYRHSGKDRSRRHRLAMLRVEEVRRAVVEVEVEGLIEQVVEARRMAVAVVLVV